MIMDFNSVSRHCYLPLQSEAMLLKHQAEAHPDEHSCNICGKAYRAPVFLRHHMKMHLDVSG